MLVPATIVAVLHGAAVLFMLAGGLLALRRPALVRLHAPLALAILGVNLAGADCPLTTLELALRARAGAPAYEGGFLGHYLLAPVGLDVHAPAVQLGLYTAALVPNALGYCLLGIRARHGRSTSTGAGRRAAVTVPPTASAQRTAATAAYAAGVDGPAPGSRAVIPSS